MLIYLQQIGGEVSLAFLLFLPCHLQFPPSSSDIFLSLSLFAYTSSSIPFFLSLGDDTNDPHGLTFH